MPSETKPIPKLPENLKSSDFTEKNIDINIPGSVMDCNIEEPKVGPVTYQAYCYRWIILVLFVLYSASNSMQWTQYTIIQDIVVQYYSVQSTLVSWTSIVYMITYVPLIFPASWVLDRWGKWVESTRKHQIVDNSSGSALRYGQMGRVDAGALQPRDGTQYPDTSANANARGPCSGRSRRRNTERVFHSSRREPPEPKHLSASSPNK